LKKRSLKERKDTSSHFQHSVCDLFFTIAFTQQWRKENTIYC
jgi:hypothetical protein